MVIYNVMTYIAVHNYCVGPFMRVPLNSWNVSWQAQGSALELYLSNPGNISAIILKFCGVISSIMKQIAEWNDHAQPFACTLWNLEKFHDMLGLGQEEDFVTLALNGFGISSWNLLKWCTVPWRLLCNLTMTSQVLRILRNFDYFALHCRGCCRPLNALCCTSL